MLGSVLAAGFYKFIKILEYETANPGQDMDHAAKVEKKKNLLMAAGINEVDAAHVAQDLTLQRAATEKGGIDGGMMANGQGRLSQENNNNEGMYGTNYRRPSGPDQNNTMSPGSSGSDQTYVPQRPAAVTTGSQIGRFSHLGRLQNQRRQSAIDTRMDSPAMATQDEIYAPLQFGGTEYLGHSVGPEVEARSRFARTTSSGV